MAKGGTPVASMSPRTMRAHLLLAEFRLDQAIDGLKNKLFSLQRGDADLLLPACLRHSSTASSSMSTASSCSPVTVTPAEASGSVKVSLNRKRKREQHGVDAQ
ncbi:hypothetical protein Slin15195_G076830 [Septoria linicola]|uniref:Uncharacterized protein n=1 Tax=Septoria linicola TaxID=215465 RepID=A0A9Q9AS13_9PEZI|nr:hypothetical protein Slin14017_G037980 [Septoria linicola]USW54364.1 hypothetical protein Slin15195_G076830 [Septoria linicola]